MVSMYGKDPISILCKICLRDPYRVLTGNTASIFSFCLLFSNSTRLFDRSDLAHSEVMSFPEVVSHQEGLEIDNSKTRPFDKYVVNHGAIDEQADPPDGHYYYPQQREICGLRRTTFLLILALTIVVLAAGIGGGVGATTAVNNTKRKYRSSKNMRVKT
jgi:hypothetical protein